MSDSPKNRSGKRTTTVVATPRTGNRIYGDDVPMPWREAAVEGGFKERTFWRYLERREITKTILGGRVHVRPSALRDFIKRQEVPAV